MDAMLGCLPGGRALIVTAVLSLALLGVENRAVAATHTTANFVVTAATDDVARRVANCAEYWRHELAVQWFEKPLPNWYRPCPISVKVGQMGASGQTTFTFENGEVHGWKMHVQGSLERILDSVVPHEVNHTIFASHFRRPLPRWADEGAATLFEHESEQARQRELLNEVIQTTRRIPLKNLLAIREYPSDMRDVLTLYAEGYSLAGFLVGMKGEQGRKVYLQFLEDAHRHGWEKAITQNYGFPSIDQLEQHWSQWILAGSPPLRQDNTQLAAAQPAAPEQQQPPQQQPSQQVALAEQPDLVVRSQSPQQESASPELESAPLFTASRLGDALPSIPRRLRTASVEPAATAMEPENESRLARPTANLSPTAEGVKTNPQAPSYAFPEARQDRFPRTGTGD